MKRLLAKFGYAAALLAAGGYAWVALSGPQGIPGLLDKRRQIRELEQHNAQLARQIEEKRTHIHRLRDSQSGQDLEIRQRLKLVKPDEKVFVLQDQK